MIFLALKDMKTQREFVADVAVEMMQDKSTDLLSPEEIRTELYQKGYEKFVEVSTVGIAGNPYTKGVKPDDRRSWNHGQTRHPPLISI